MNIVGCFLEHEGKFPILLRHSHKPNGNTWGLPAGKVDAGETYKQAAIRELREETGYIATINQIEHLGSFEFGEQHPYIFHTYRVLLAKPFQIQLETSAHQSVRWVTAQECYDLPNLVPDLHDLLVRIGYKKLSSTKPN